jgi:DNA invertase Pin-like site-specific DNA recombinase
MNPPIYGYMRVSLEGDDAVVREVEQGLRRFAEEHGFVLRGIFYEYTSGSQTTFDQLVCRLQEAGARHVVVPSLAHFSGSPLIRNHLLMRLEDECKAEVFETVETIEL